MRRSARWWRRRSLRARLTAAAVVVIATTLTLAVTLRLEAALTVAAEEAASDRADIVAQRIAEPGSSIMIETAGVEIVEIVTADGSMAASSEEAGPLLPLRSTSATAITQRGVPLPGEEDEPFRVGTRPVTSPSGQMLFVQVGMPLDDAEESVHELMAALGVGLPRSSRSSRS